MVRCVVSRSGAMRLLAAVVTGLVLGTSPATAAPSAVEALGKSLFFDQSLSHGGNQSCATCHNPSNAFTDPDKSNPTSRGSNLALFGKRNAPSVSYMAFSPDFHFDADEGLYIGGQFYDGRAATLEEQAKQPLVGKVEMGNANPAEVVAKLAAGPNAEAFKAVFGADAFADTDVAYHNLASAIAAYERTPEVSPFSSKFDLYLDGKVALKKQEQRGFEVFSDPMKGNCSACHISVPGEDGSHPMFTDFTYDNIGIPKNFDNKFLTLSAEYNPDGEAFIDLGMGAFVGDPSLYGTFKVTTLRNIALTGPYGHNGYFQTLYSAVDFYATRDVKPTCVNPNTSSVQAEFLGCWPAPEVPATLNNEELGNLPLTEQDKRDIVAFLGTLTDGYRAVPEPATWAMMIVGFGLVGLRLSARRRIELRAG